MVHRNAPPTETGRLRLARGVVDDRWLLRRAAERFQVSPTTAKRWADRYREQGPTGMTDRSSHPHLSPRQTPTRTERRIIKVRVLRRWGPARIAYLLGLNPSTVHCVLSRWTGEDLQGISVCLPATWARTERSSGCPVGMARPGLTASCDRGGLALTSALCDAQKSLCRFRSSARLRLPRGVP